MRQLLLSVATLALLQDGAVLGTQLQQSGGDQQHTGLFVQEKTHQSEEQTVHDPEEVTDTQEEDTLDEPGDQNLLSVGNFGWNGRVIQTGIGGGQLGTDYYFVREKYVYHYDAKTEKAGWTHTLRDWGIYSFNVDCAVSSDDYKQVYFFKDSQYWAYDWTTKKTSGPYHISGWTGIPKAMYGYDSKTLRMGLDAVFDGKQAGHNRLYFVKGDKYWAYNPKTKKGAFSKPRSMKLWKVDWGTVDAAVPAIDKFGAGIYFFKGSQYMKYRKDGGVEKPSGTKSNIASWHFPKGWTNLANPKYHECYQTLMYSRLSLGAQCKKLCKNNNAAYTRYGDKCTRLGLA